MEEFLHALLEGRYLYALHLEERLLLWKKWIGPLAAGPTIRWEMWFPLKSPSVYHKSLSRIELDDPLFLDVRVDLLALRVADNLAAAVPLFQPARESPPTTWELPYSV